MNLKSHLNLTYRIEIPYNVLKHKTRLFFKNTAIRSEAVDKRYPLPKAPIPTDVCSYQSAATE